MPKDREADVLMRRAWRARTVIPGFNVAYLPMIEPVVRALRDTRCFGLVSVSRPDWAKLGAGSLAAVRDACETVKDERFARLHVDHVPVIDEDGLAVDAESILRQAVGLGYPSIMIDASRLPLGENIAVVRRVVGFAHAAGVAVEAELGAVMGHEPGPLPPYEELFASGRGFTDPDEARRFVAETGADWLSVAVGSVHGTLSERRVEKKVEARLHIEHLDRVARAADVPLVLHGGTGIRKAYVLEAVRHGIAKINVATAIRQPYEAAMAESIEKAQAAVYEATARVIRQDLEIEGSVDVVNPA